MVAVVVPVKEEDVPESGTKKPGNAAVDADVDDVFFVAAAIVFGEEVADTGGQDDGEREYEPIGAYRKLPNVEQILMHEEPPAAGRPAEIE
jgi:hypothetical protein